MKKNLLFVAAVCAAMTMSAQEFGKVPADLGTEAVAHAAGTEIASSANITMKVAFEDNYKNVGLAMDPHTTFLIGDVEFDGSLGMQGSSNPKDIDGGSPDATLKAPATGAVIEFTAKADGFVYVPAKLSSNKSYTVFEEGTCIGYRLAMLTTNELLGLLDIEIKGSGELNEVTEPILWPEKYSPNYADADIKVNGMGVIKFQVYEGCSYLVNAVGAKISFAGFYFDTDGKTQVSLIGDGADPVVIMAGEGGTGIQGSAVAKDVVSTSYISVSGVELAQPEKGVTIVRNVMSDGSVVVTKEMR